MSKKCWLIGAGYMAAEYIRVLKSNNIDFLVITRGSERAISLEKDFNISVKSGGISNLLNSEQNTPDYAIVAVSVEELTLVVFQLIERGIKNILIEKPAGLIQEEIDRIVIASLENGVNVFVAYNRRFYSSVKYLKDKIKEDGGVKSLNFEFTEWIHTIDEDKFPPHVLDKFVIANSSHVIDTVFHIIGKPKEMTCFVSGDEVKWHPSGSIFVGSGISEQGALFTYSSNWGAPGRWGIEISTSKRKYYLKPLERLSIQEKGSVQVNEVDADYSIDELHKPGLMNMVNAFFNEDKEALCTIGEHQQNFRFYDKIAGYIN
jgi:predicted dehydrogenase